MEVCGLWPSHTTTKIPLVTIASAAVFEEKKHGIPQVLQPRYSPDPELCDIFLLKKDSHLKGKKISRRRRNRSECNEATDRYQKKESQDCFPQRKRHLDKVSTEVKSSIDICGSLLLITPVPILFDHTT